MRLKSKLRLAGYCLAGMLLALGLKAQTQNAAISGTMTDSTGAAMAGATVQARNVGTGISQSVMSDEQGR